jgi:hypothetical protein
MRLLIWTDTFFQYVQETLDNHVESVFSLISRGIVEGCILQKTYREIALDDELIDWNELPTHSACATCEVSDASTAELS